MSVYLATRGQQDYFLTERPEFTFFHKKYERDVQHKNIIATVPFDSGGGTIASLPLSGDYISEITLKVTLPPLKETTKYWTFLGTPPSGNISFYKNSSDSPLLSINSSNYLSYISPAGNFVFDFTKNNTTQSFSITSTLIVADSASNYYLLGSDLNLNKNNSISVATSLSSQLAYMVLSKNGAYIYISDYFAGTIIQVKTSDMSVNASYYTGLIFPTSMSIDNNGKLYVLCGYDTKTVEVINTIPIIPTITTIALPNPFSYLLCVDFVGQYIYLLYGNNAITRVETANQEIIEYYAGVENEYVSDMQIDSTNTLYFAYFYTGTIVSLALNTGIITPNYIINLNYPISMSITSNNKFYILGNYLLYFNIIAVGAGSGAAINYMIFDNIDIANYYGFTSNLTQLLGGYYRYSLPVATAYITSARYLDECGWAHLVTNELMNNPAEMATSPDGTLVYFVDSQNSVIRKMTTSTPYSVTTIAGTPGISGSTDGPGSSALFFSPQGITITPNGEFLYIADTKNSTIRRMSTSSPYTVTTIAGLAGVVGYTNGFLGYSRFNNPQSITINSNATRLYVADTQNSIIRSIDLTVAAPFQYGTGTVAGIATVFGSTDGNIGTSTLNYPQAVKLSPDGQYLYIADTQNFTIRKMSTASPFITTTIAGAVKSVGNIDGIGANARFNTVQSLAINKDGTILYIGDANTIRQMSTISPYTVTTLAGIQDSPGAADGLGTNSTFNIIQGLAISNSGTLIYLSDTGNNILRQMSTISPYTVTTLAGSPYISGTSDTGIDQYPDDTMYYYINSISLSIGKQLIQQLPGGYLKMKRDISNTYKNRPILKLLEGDTNTSSSNRIYFFKTGLINNIPMHLLANQDVQVTVDTIIQQKSLIIEYVSFGTTKLPLEYTLIVPQVQLFHGSGSIDIKSPITKLMSDSPFQFSINGENLFDSDTSNVSQFDNLLNISTGYINVFKGPMNMSRIRDKKISGPALASNIWAETFNVLKIENGLSGLLFESSFYSFGAPSSYLIS